MRYSICNNSNVQETSTTDRNEARRIAQRIANRDNEPAFVDAYVDGACDETNSWRVEPAARA